MSHLGEETIRELGRKADGTKKIIVMKAAGYMVIKELLDHIRASLPLLHLQRMSKTIKEGTKINKESEEYKQGFADGQLHMFHQIASVMDTTHRTIIEERNIIFEKLVKQEEKKRSRFHENFMG